jgi:hypothetical protein
MASELSTQRRDMMILLILQAVFIVAFFCCTRYDNELGATYVPGNTTALDHYYPCKLTHISIRLVHELTTAVYVDLRSSQMHWQYAF